MTDQLPRYIKPTNPQGPSNKREDEVYKKAIRAGLAEADALKARAEAAEAERDDAIVALEEMVLNLDGLEEEVRAIKRRVREHISKHGGTDET